ncbi:MAG: carbamoyl phosphate synthase small subunit [Defluviitaleaceae bacterium]|nr:carbamoyl phosphate synthase small subunit [Defluviitaleaceae bacterium]
MGGKNINIRLILENGQSFGGCAFGYFKEEEDIVGEMVFNTGLTGYQEAFTDPAYAGKLMCMTTPLIGSYGLNFEDMQSDKARLKALIVRHKSDYPSNWRCEMTLDGFLKQNKVLGMEELDTRALTRIMRENGTMKAIITTKDLSADEIKAKFSKCTNENITKEITAKEKYIIEGKGLHLALLDLGVKTSVLKALQRKGAKITVFPAFSTAAEILEANPDGIFLSGGAGNVDNMAAIVNTAAELATKKPVAAIGLGHLVLAKALGCTISPMKFGHHGGNYPVKSLESGKAYITSQGHDYVVTDCPADIIPTYINVNDKSIEGIKHKTLHVSGVQWAPEGNPGPETEFIFDDFLKMIEEWRLVHA